MMDESVRSIYFSFLKHLIEIMPQKLKKRLDDVESDLDESSESTLPTDPTVPGLSLLDVRIKRRDARARLAHCSS